MLYGQGAVAGALNVVDKAPELSGEPQFEALASGGSFGSCQRWVLAVRLTLDDTVSHT